MKNKNGYSVGNLQMISDDEDHAQEDRGWAERVKVNDFSRNRTTVFMRPRLTEVAINSYPGEINFFSSCFLSLCFCFLFSKSCALVYDLMGIYKKHGENGFSLTLGKAPNHSLTERAHYSQIINYISWFALMICTAL